MAASSVGEPEGMDAPVWVKDAISGVICASMTLPCMMHYLAEMYGLPYL
jgi:hypothetical protein